MSEVKKLQKKLKYCEKNLKKAIDELWKIKKKKNRPTPTVNKELNYALKKVLKIEDHINKNKDDIARNKVNEMKRRALKDAKKFNFDDPFTLPPIKGGKKKRKYKKRSKK